MKRTNTGIGLITFVLVIVSIVSLLPFYIMIIMGTHENADLFKGIVILPGRYLFKNIATIFEGGFLRYYANSLYIAVLSTVLSILVSAMAGFSFAKYDFKGKKKLFYFILSTMMVPGQLGLIAFIVEMRYMKWVNTHLPLIIPSAASAFGVFWMTQYILGSVPSEVMDSSRIDGCSEPGIFFRIVLPYIKPAIATLSMLGFLGSWNSYLVPLILLNDTNLYTVPLGIATLGNLYRTEYAVRITALTLGTLPLLIIFSIGTKSFTRGLTTGAVKG